MRYENHSETYIEIQILVHLKSQLILRLRFHKKRGKNLGSPLSYIAATNSYNPFTLIKYSAICTALSAAPFFIWSLTAQKLKPFSSVKSLRTRPT